MAWDDAQIFTCLSKERLEGSHKQLPSHLERGGGVVGVKCSVHHQPSVHRSSHLPVPTPTLDVQQNEEGYKRKLSLSSSIPLQKKRNATKGVQLLCWSCGPALRGPRGSGGSWVSGAGRWPAAHGPAPTLATSASVISLPRLLPLKIRRSSSSASRRAPGAKLSGKETAESKERGRVGKKSQAAPGLFRRSLFPGLFRTPPSPVELQKLLIAMLMKSGGCGERVSETLLEEGKFLFLPSSPSPPPEFLPASPLRSSLSIPRLESRWPSLALCHGSVRSSQPHGLPAQPQSREGGLGTRGSVSPGFPAFRLGALRAGPANLRPPGELRPTNSRPERAGSPLPFSPLASSSFSAQWGGGGSGGRLSAPTSRRPGGAGSGVGRAQKAAFALLRSSTPNRPLQSPQQLPPPGLPGGATARHLDGGAPGI